MKTGILSIAALLWSLAAQTLYAQPYTPFPGANTMWTEAFRYSDFYPYSFHFYKLGNQDTVINGTPYHKLYKADDTSFANAVLAGGLRDDTAARKVYFYNQSNEILLYDFSVQAGDTIHGNANNYHNNWRNDLIVHSVDSLFFNGSYHRRINLRMAFSLNNDILPAAWVEGMGNQVRGIVFPSGTLPNNGQWNELICMYQGSQPIYHNMTDWNKFDTGSLIFNDCPFSSGVGIRSETLASLRVQLYPNPVTGTSTLTLPTGHHFDWCSIYDAAGRKVAFYNVEGHEQIRIEQTNFTPGIYMYSLTGKEVQPQRGMFTIR